MSQEMKEKALTSLTSNIKIHLLDAIQDINTGKVSDGLKTLVELHSLMVAIEPAIVKMEENMARLGEIASKRKL